MVRALSLEAWLSYCTEIITTACKSIEYLYNQIGNNNIDEETQGLMIVFSGSYDEANLCQKRQKAKKTVTRYVVVHFTDTASLDAQVTEAIKHATVKTIAT